MKVRQEVHLLSILLIHQGGFGSCSQLKLTLGERQGAEQVTNLSQAQSIIHTRIHTYGHYRVAS